MAERCHRVERIIYNATRNDELYMFPNIYIFLITFDQYSVVHPVSYIPFMPNVSSITAVLCSCIPNTLSSAVLFTLHKPDDVTDKSYDTLLYIYLTVVVVSLLDRYSEDVFLLFLHHVSTTFEVPALVSKLATKT